MTMFNERGVIDGGLTLRTDDYGSERLYGPKRYPVFLRMLSKEVDDVMVQKLMPLDVLTSRVPHCSMPAPEAVQVKVTTAYMFSPEVASAYVMASLDARQALGLADCSSGPEVRIFDHLWRGKDMLNSDPRTQGFDGTWGLVADNNPQWYDVLHVDQWYDAQHVQRQGVSAVPVLREMSDEDEGRRIWPIAVSAMKQQNTGSSNAVKWGVTGFPWSGSGFDLTRGMTATYQRSHWKEGFPCCSGTDSWWFGPRKGLNFVGYLLDCKGCRDIFDATTFGSVFCFVKGGHSRKCSKQSRKRRRTGTSCKGTSSSEDRWDTDGARTTCTTFQR